MPATINEQLIAELRRISILLALNLTKGQPQSDQIEVLATVGFKPKEIADILDTTPNTVSVTLSRRERRNKSKRAPMTESV